MTVDELEVLITANTKDLRAEMAKATKDIDSLKKSADTSTNGVLSAFKNLKTGIAALGIGKVIKDIITTGMDANESDSMFGAVFKDSAESVHEWSEEVSKALGLNSTAVRKHASVIFSMTKSMGVSEENALKLSKGISLMTEDFASFYNLDSEEAFNKLKSGLSGEAEPLKALGKVVDENTIKQVAYSHGIAQTGAELTTQQKVLARYVAIMEQSKDAQGDLARTMDSGTNQYRKLQNQINDLYISLSSFLMPAVKTILTWFNALAKAVSNVVNNIAVFFGLTGSGGLSEETQIASENVGGISVGLDDANKQAKKLKSNLAGFDEMNVLSEDTSDSADTSGGGDGGGGFVLDDYDAGLDDLTGEIEDLTGKAEIFLGILGTVGATMLGWKIGKAVYNFFKNPGELGFFKKMGDLFGVTDELGALTTGDKFSSLGGALLTVAGAASFMYGAFDSLSNGVDWGNLAFMVGGLAAAATGLYFAIKPFSSTMAPIISGVVLVAGGLAMLVIGVKDFIANGPTLQNTILIIGGAIAIAVGVATMGLGPLIGALVGAAAAVAAFTAAILLEEPAIMSVTAAQENLTAAKERAKEAENSYINAVDASEAALKRLEEAEKAAGITGEELYAKVQAGTLDYKDMTAEQREVYKAYLDNEQKQKDLIDSTNAFNEAKKAETIASYENQLALAKESGNYDEFKKSVVDAFQKGELSADEARELIAKSMSEMSNEAQQTFMKDIPDSLKEGLDPHKYESTGTKISKFFGDMWNGICDGAKWAWDGLVGFLKNTINWIIDGINLLWGGIYSAVKGIVDAIGGIAGAIGSIFGQDWHFSMPAEPPLIPRLARGGIVDSPTYAMIGEAGKEAVMPLERNTGWIDQLADKLADKIGGGSGEVHLTVKLGEDKIFDKFIKYSKEKAFETNGEVVFA